MKTLIDSPPVTFALAAAVLVGTAIISMVGALTVMVLGLTAVGLGTLANLGAHPEPLPVRLEPDAPDRRSPGHHEPARRSSGRRGSA